MEKIGNRQTKDRIADMLREEILSGRIADGIELTQEQLADRLEVSRMPVREALQTLELEGLLLRLPNRHMQVVGLNKKTVSESMRLIAAVELEMALMILEQAHDRPKDNISEGSERFHQWLSAHIENPYLAQTYKRLLNGYPLYILKHARSDIFDAQTRVICDAFNRRDVAALTRAIRKYYADMATEIIKRSEGDL